MTARWKVVAFVAPVVALGCAHTQQARTEEASKPAVVAVPVPVSPVAEAAPSQESQDMEALLRATVIHFDFNADVLTPDSQERLNKLADAMRKHHDVAVKIAGNCDERGTEEYNIALGQRRADVAKKYLASLGLNNAKLSTVSYGKENPADPGHTEEAWAANRRDEFQPQSK